MDQHRLMLARAPWTTPDRHLIAQHQIRHPTEIRRPMTCFMVQILMIGFSHPLIASRKCNEGRHRRVMGKKLPIVLPQTLILLSERPNPLLFNLGLNIAFPNGRSPFPHFGEAPLCWHLTEDNKQATKLLDALCAKGTLFAPLSSCCFSPCYVSFFIET